MDNFKRFYCKNQINEDLSDVLGDVKDAAIEKAKAKLSSMVPQGIKKVASRLFNVENDITKFTTEEKFKDLGKLLVDKKIPQEFKYKRVKLFNTLYRDIPLFFAITSMLFFKGNYQKAFADIEAGGNIDITTYLKQLYNGLDILSFILRIPNLQFNQSLVDTSITPLIKALMNFGYKFEDNKNSAVTIAARTGSLPLFKSIIENGKIKITPEILSIVNKLDNQEIKDYVDSVNKPAAGTPSAGTPAPSGTTGTNTLPDLSKYGYDPKATVKQTISLAKAKDLAFELAKTINPQAKKLAIYNRNAISLLPKLVELCDKLGIAKDIEIV